MALGSGSSLATDRWRRRSGFVSSEKLLRVGRTTRLNHNSSWKPMAHRGSASATSISRSRRLSVSLASKAASAAIASVHRLLSYPNSLGERWSIPPRRASAPSPSKAERVRLGREDLACRAARPRSLKSWMALRAVWEPHPSERAIRGARSPLLLARMIWARRMMKASLERSAVCNCSFSVSESDGRRMEVSWFPL